MSTSPPPRMRRFVRVFDRNRPGERALPSSAAEVRAELLTEEAAVKSCSHHTGNNGRYHDTNETAIAMATDSKPARPGERGPRGSRLGKSVAATKGNRKNTINGNNGRGTINRRAAVVSGQQGGRLSASKYSYGVCRRSQPVPPQVSQQQSRAMWASSSPPLRPRPILRFRHPRTTAVVAPPVQKRRPVSETNRWLSVWGEKENGLHPAAPTASAATAGAAAAAAPPALQTTRIAEGALEVAERCATTAVGDGRRSREGRDG